MSGGTKLHLTPVHYFSHGTPNMLGEESPSANYWKKCGDEALRHGVKHVIMMVSGDVDMILMSESCIQLTGS